jgi:hypothetical protein
MTKTILAALFVAATLMIGTVSPSAFADPIWSATGDGVTVTDADQNDGISAFEYSVTRGDFDERTWVFETTAKKAGTVTLQYEWTGFHAFFQVTTDLQSFDDQGTTTLVDEGPINCCTSPSAGFNYVGTTTLELEKGEKYGFVLKGDNSDSDNRLLGSFTVTDVTEKKSCDALDDAEDNGNGKHKGIPKAKENNGCN